MKHEETEPALMRFKDFYYKNISILDKITHILMMPDHLYVVVVVSGNWKMSKEDEKSILV